MTMGMILLARRLPTWYALAASSPDQ